MEVQICGWMGECKFATNLTKICTEKKGKGEKGGVVGVW